MGSDPLLREVRRQLGLGRLLPLGLPEDGAWVTERAAGAALLRAVAALPGVRAEGLRIGPAGDGGEAVVPPPPSALPPGPLRIGASVAVGADRPLTDSAAEVRAALTAAADERLGLDVVAVDVEVSGLLPQAPPPDVAAAPEPPAPGVGPASGTGAAVAAAVLAVPGVLGLSGAVGGPSRGVEVTAGGVRVQLTADASRRAVDVARAAASAVTAVTEAPVTVLIGEIRAPA
ncbi:hypothetical protein [Streptomyces specialis]|uniref:hypothetical protein n=1 Tax=Streptomyces specialis TaxID=498367 RepID=UPI00073F6375|nr:hypothetical protein [Streptomyces specialis]